MRRTVLVLLVATALSAAVGAHAVSPAADVGERTSLVSVLAGDRIQVLQEHFDLTEHGVGGWYDVVAHPGDLDRLEQLGFTVRTVLPDLKAAEAAALRADAAAQAAEPSVRLSYRRLMDYELDLHRLAWTAPELVRLITLPHPTHEGRAVTGVEIAADVSSAATDGRPAVLLDGLHHAREWPSAELPMMFAEDLVASYQDGDPQITSLLEALRVIVVPVMNPDGFVRSREVRPDDIVPLPAGSLLGPYPAYHRKNLRQNPGGSEGVDPNRNYTFLWGGDGSAAHGGSEVYHGPGPASEPETANIQKLVESNQVVAYISNHTFSNLVLRPWGHTGVDAPDEPALRSLGDRMAAHNHYRSCKGIQLYPTTGTASDWAYAASGSLGYTFEIGAMGPHDTGPETMGCDGLRTGNLTPVECAGFHPQYALCVPRFYAENRPAYLELLQAAADDSSHAVVRGTAPPGTTIRFDRTVVLRTSTIKGNHPVFHALSSSVVVGPDGTYAAHLNPSASPYTIALGGVPERYTVTAHYPDGTTDSVLLAAARGGVYTLNL
jgi:hypothetical protein